MPKATPPALPEVNFSELGDVRFLHLGTPWVQGSMLKTAPFELELEYVQRMMAGLLFVPSADVGRLHAMQLGLGAAALTKFCRKSLRLAKTTAIEINPQVVSACRQWFKLPANDSRLAVIQADAALEIQQPQHFGTVDLLHVDLYDEEAAAPVLDTAYFYADCQRLLTEGGSMTVNLFGRDAGYAQSIEKIGAAFGQANIWAFKPTREGNAVVLAQRTASRPTRAELQASAEAIESRWDLPARKWLRLFAPVRVRV